MAAVIVAVVGMIALAGCSGDAGTSAESTRAASPLDTACIPTSADANHIKEFVVTHTADSRAVDTLDGPAFAHVLGVSVSTASANTENVSVTILDDGGAILAELNDMAPGITCGVDYDFGPGNYTVRSADGTSTEFTSFADADAATTQTSAPVGPTGGGTAALTYDGQTYEFGDGRCSMVLDPGQFVFRDPSTPGLDATYLAVTVTDVVNTSSEGGEHEGAVTFQQDGVIILSLAEATLNIAADLRSGTFTGEDEITSKPAVGSYTC